MNTGFDLSRWIDPATGDVIIRQSDYSQWGSSEEVYSLSRLLDELLEGDNSTILMNNPGLHIELSEEIITKSALVYPGINAEIMRARPSDWAETDGYRNEDCHNDTRERQMKNEYTLFGKFLAPRGRSKSGTIILYTKAISAYANSKALDFEEVFWPTLAHEVFYAFHYYMLHNKGKADRWSSRFSNRKNRELVIESLAEFFEHEFAYGGSSISGTMTDEWERFDIDGWPASGALGILKSKQPKYLFEELFNLTFYDWKTAADIIRTGYYLCSPEIKKILRA